MTIPGAQNSALDFIKAALRNLNVLASGEESTGDEGQDCLVALNQLIDTWNADGLTMFTTETNDFPLTANKQTYTLGDGGDFNMTRPKDIYRASVVIQGAQPIEYPIPIFTTQDWRDRVPVKNTSGNLPLIVYDDGDFPLRLLTFWPSASDTTIFRIYSDQPLTQFSTLKQIASYPPGYAEAITSNLAVRLAALFPPAQVSAATAAIAIESLATLKLNNADDTQLRSDIMSEGTASRMRAEMFGIPSL